MKPKQLFEQVRKEGRQNLTESESREVLGYYGIPVVEGIIARNVEHAVAFAQKFGFPLVLKIASRDIIHKTDLGGVIVGIKNEKELREGFNEILNRIKMRTPTARIDGIFVQKMLPNAPEVIIGGKKDATFDQVILFGLGGVFVEVFNDVSFRVVPVKEMDAAEMISEIKGLKILKGIRGQQPVDFKALIDIITKTSRLLEDNPDIKELDINPVFALPKGAIAVDARIIID